MDIGNVFSSLSDAEADCKRWGYDPLAAITRSGMVYVVTPVYRDPRPEPEPGAGPQTGWDPSSDVPPHTTIVDGSPGIRHEIID